MQQSKTQWAIIIILAIQSIVLIAVVYDNKNDSISEQDSGVKSVETPNVHALSENQQAILAWKIESIVRGVVKEELNNFVERNDIAHGVSAENKSTAIQEPEIELTYEQELQREQSFSVSRSLIAGAIESGIWTREASLQLSAYATNLSEKQRIELIQRFHEAVARHQLEVEPENIPVL